jgi:anionic cell wall polymer biosynthesis LytR-Cps2A-Psr (LCP) family protein
MAATAPPSSSTARIITLRGEEALAYVRERKQLPHGDLDRAERQRVVLQAILAKGLAKETISNPLKFVSFVREYRVTSRSMSS